MALPIHSPFNNRDKTCYSPSVGASPVAAYTSAPFRGRILGVSGILGGALTTADATVTVTNVTQGVTVGTFAVPQSGSAAGQMFSGQPATVSSAQVNASDVISIVAAGASGTNIPMHFSVAFREG